jgi:fido (protein-threonine AMPylation protein)
MYQPLPLRELPYAKLLEITDANHTFLQQLARFPCAGEQEFIKRSFLDAVYLSNKLEETFVGDSSPDATYSVLEELYTSQSITEALAANLPAEAQAAVAAEAAEEAEAAAVAVAAAAEVAAAEAEAATPTLAQQRRQLTDHMAALKYLCVLCKPGSTPLTVDMIKHTHKLLMGSMLDDSSSSSSVPAGEFRLTPCRSGTGFQYLQPEYIHNAVHAAVCSFNSALAAAVHPVQAAADLFYSVIAIHPFCDGNGRLCRLLASYAFMCSGVPFSVTLCNGHRKSAKHLLVCLQRADRVGSDRHSLYSYFVLAVAQSCSEYVTMCS